MILFNVGLVTVSLLLGLVAALFIGASVYQADMDDDDERVQELLSLAKVGFVITISVMAALHLIANLIT